MYTFYIGNDPFTDEDPMKIYQNVLKGKVKFPIGIDISAKSLIKKLLTPDLTKRYGNLKGGVNDIKNHRFFKGLDWEALLEKKIAPNYIPVIE